MRRRRVDTGWMDRALCSDYPRLGWIDEPHQVLLGEESEMARVCARCPVLTSCAAYVEQTNVTAGFWAGSFWTPHGPLLPITGDAA